jgi:hypothetical protein
MDIERQGHGIGIPEVNNLESREVKRTLIACREGGVSNKAPVLLYRLALAAFALGLKPAKQGKSIQTIAAVD